MRSVSLLIIGDITRPEFAPVAQALSDESLARRSASSAHAFAAHDDLACAELVVWLQSAPGEIAPEEISHLRRVAPLAAIAVVFGPWCEGESRAAACPAGVMRIPAHRWPSWWRRQLRQIENGRSPEWLLPATMSNDELWLARPATNRSKSVQGQKITVGVVSVDRQFSAALEESLRAAGLEVKIYLEKFPNFAHRSATEQMPDVVVWCLHRNQLDKEHDVPIEAAGIPWIALVHFPRPMDRKRLVDRGASDVFALPLDLDDLLESLIEAGRPMEANGR